MHFIAENLKYLRKQEGWTQGEFARQLGVKRSLIGAYEEGRADPRISFLMHICQKFGYTMDQLVSDALDQSIKPGERIAGQNLRILPITIDKSENTEKVTLVPIHAAAGYLNGFGDVEYIESLPVFDLPFPEVSRGKTYRVFQIKGESMLPVPSGAYILCSYVLDWNNIKNDDLYVFVTNTEGIVFKRALNNIKEGYLTLKSDNPEFDTFELELGQLVEVWKAEGMTTFGFDQSSTIGQEQLLDEIRGIRKKLDDLASK